MAIRTIHWLVCASVGRITAVVSAAVAVVATDVVVCASVGGIATVVSTGVAVVAIDVVVRASVGRIATIVGAGVVVVAINGATALATAARAGVVVGAGVAVLTRIVIVDVAASRSWIAHSVGAIVAVIRAIGLGILAYAVGTNVVGAGIAIVAVVIRLARILLAHAGV